MTYAAFSNTHINAAILTDWITKRVRRWHFMEVRKDLTGMTMAD